MIDTSKLPTLKQLYDSDPSFQLETYLTIMGSLTKSMKNLSPNSIIFCSCMRFLLKFYAIFEWQLDTLLILFLACSFYKLTIQLENDSVIQGLPLGSLYQVLLKDSSTANIACGYPLGVLKPHQFFDGVLWMGLYTHVNSHRSLNCSTLLETIFGKVTEVLDTFNLLKREILVDFDSNTIFKGLTKEKKERKAQVKYSSSPFSENSFSVLELVDPFE